MRTRSTLEICLPLVLFVAACAFSLETRVIAIAWMTIGVVSLGHRTVESFPRDGINWRWLRGYRAACLMFYHLAWWPWYMRASLRDGVDRIGKGRFTRKKSAHHEPDNPSDWPHSNERDENRATGARQEKEID